MEWLVSSFGFHVVRKPLSENLKLETLNLKHFTIDASRIYDRHASRSINQERYNMKARKRPASETMQPESISMLQNGFIAGAWKSGVSAAASLQVSKIERIA